MQKEIGDETEWHVGVTAMPINNPVQLDCNEKRSSQ